MNLVPERTATGRILPLLISLLAVAVWWAVSRGLLWPADSYRCPLLDRTGLACPTCGGIRASLAVGRGDVLGALVENPLVAIGLLVLGIWLIYAVAATAVRPWRRVPELTPREGRMLRRGVLGMMAATWIYEIVRHLD